MREYLMAMGLVGLVGTTGLEALTRVSDTSR